MGQSYQSFNWECKNKGWPLLCQSFLERLLAFSSKSKALKYWLKNHFPFDRDRLKKISNFSSSVSIAKILITDFQLFKISSFT